MRENSRPLRGFAYPPCVRGAWRRETGHEAGRKGLRRTTKEVEMKDLKERAIKATKLFLERRGYEVVETGRECPAGAIAVVA